ncbi:MAG: hypothetical protein JWO67_2682 [Streptosporangiaceae bacterium]|nr:hypothetical protein [Streptosporangiaceae bacterium]
MRRGQESTYVRVWGEGRKPVSAVRCARFEASPPDRSAPDRRPCLNWGKVRADLVTIRERTQATCSACSSLGSEGPMCRRGACTREETPPGVHRCTFGGHGAQRQRLPLRGPKTGPPRAIARARKLRPSQRLPAAPRCLCPCRTRTVSPNEVRLCTPIGVPRAQGRAPTHWDPQQGHRRDPACTVHSDGP